jgi:hypothetical protein
MSNQFHHSAPKALALVDGLDEYLQDWLSRSQRGLVKRIKDVEDRFEFLSPNPFECRHWQNEGTVGSSASFFIC